MTSQTSATARARGGTGALLDPDGRVQNALVLGSVLVLASTGLPQRFGLLGVSSRIIDAAGGIETLRTIHHGAGGLLIAAVLYHALSVLVAVLRYRNYRPLSMIPDARDYRDALANALYLAGMRQRRPALREPTYFQKLDYWVVAWLLTVMAITGIIRLFPATMTHLLSGDVVAAALETHSSIAMLVAVWILVIHGAYASHMVGSTGSDAGEASHRPTGEVRTVESGRQG